MSRSARFPIVAIAAMSAAIVFVTLGVIYNFGIHLPVFSHLPQVEPCVHRDQSLCNLEWQLKQYVVAKDSSDILEQQQPTRIVCDKAYAAQPYCNNEASGLPVELFMIESTSGSPHYLTRNSYISVLNNYFSTHGPFSYISDTTGSADITMHFANKTQLPLDILLQETTRHWIMLSIKISQN